MIRNDLSIRSLMYGDIVSHLTKTKNISINEARTLVSKMSFRDYTSIIEEIVPPSGQTMGTPASTQATTAPTKVDSKIKSIWPGKGAPLEVGMTVGATSPDGASAPSTVSQVDMQAKGVKIKNPKTGKEEWANIDTLQPYTAQDQPGAPQPTTEDTVQLSRLRKLAGIRENTDSSSTSACAIATAPTAMSTVRRRQPTDETLKKEYTPKSAETIIGDTKPHQASGELSATLAANGKKTATRIRNGRRA